MYLDMLLTTSNNNDILMMLFPFIYLKDKCLRKTLCLTITSNVYAIIQETLKHLPQVKF